MFLLLQGTAIGNNFALTYANIRMRQIEANFNFDVKHYFMKNWRQFLHHCETHKLIKSE